MVKGMTDLRLYLNGLIVVHKVRVCPLADHDIILGLDFLKENSTILSYQENILNLRDDLVRLPLYSKTQHISCITVAKNMCVPPFTEVIIPVISPTVFNN